jgi:hypothetical protein
MAHFTFTDLDDGDETWVGVRATNDGVGLTLSKKANGDMEVFMRREVAVQLAAALRETADGRTRGSGVVPEHSPRRRTVT